MMMTHERRGATIWRNRFRGTGHCRRFQGTGRYRPFPRDRTLRTSRHVQGQVPASGLHEWPMPARIGGADHCERTSCKGGTRNLGYHMLWTGQLMRDRTLREREGQTSFRTQGTGPCDSASASEESPSSSVHEPGGKRHVSKDTSFPRDPPLQRTKLNEREGAAAGSIAFRSSFPTEG